jgi:hypothetical protein
MVAIFQAQGQDAMNDIFEWGVADVSRPVSGS